MKLRMPSGAVVTGRPENVAIAAKVAGDMASEKRAWIASLREQGVKAAHPDDGWVNRDRNEVYLSYPDFNDGLGVGDLLALGWPWGDTRIVRVTGKRTPYVSIDMTYWSFEELPPPPAPRRWWHRFIPTKTPEGK